MECIWEKKSTWQIACYHFGMEFSGFCAIEGDVKMGCRFLASHEGNLNSLAIEEMEMFEFSSRGIKFFSHASLKYSAFARMRGVFFLSSFKTVSWEQIFISPLVDFSAHELISSIT